MKDLAIVVFIVLVKVLVTAFHDISFGISCIMEPLTWQKAVDNCISTGGRLVSFKTGLGSELDKLNLTFDTDVWIASYLQNETNEKDLCGFNYLNKSYTNNAEVFFGRCDENRNYFCKTKTEPKLVVYNSTRANVSCNETVSSNELLTYSNQIKSGLYWSTLTLKAVEVEIIEERRSDTNKQYCGAYNRVFGKYFANCSEKRLSLCGNFDTSASSWTRKINTQCFDVFNKKTTPNAKQSTFVSKVTLVTNKKSVTSDSNMFASSSRKAHITTSSATESEKDKMSIQGGEEKEETSDIGVTIGIPIGIVLLLMCGVLIILYINRRRVKCCQSSNSKHENERMNQLHSQETSPAHRQLNVYSECIQQTPSSAEQQTNENNFTDDSAQYAVVTKPKKGDTKFRKDDYSNKSCQNVTNDEYDAASSFQNCRSNQADNLYNHFESADEYNSTSFVREEEGCNNLYNTTEDRNPIESTYDFTTEVNNKALPDDVYNHLS